MEKIADETYLFDVFPRSEVRVTFTGSVRNRTVTNYLWYGTGSNGKTLCSSIVKKALGVRAHVYSPGVEYPYGSVVFAEDKEVPRDALKKLNANGVSVILIRNEMMSDEYVSDYVLIPFETRFCENPTKNNERLARTNLDINRLASML
jgi:hypothetical protein